MSNNSNLCFVSLISSSSVRACMETGSNSAYHFLLWSPVAAALRLRASRAFWRHDDAATRLQVGVAVQYQANTALVRRGMRLQAAMVPTAKQREDCSGGSSLCRRATKLS
uniref:Uncharacterized protein n=1 Tax=Arundo donax TaxID=35708 RepID=A0A0A9D4U6_ARUDO